MSFDWTISVGTLIQATPWLVIGLWFLFGTRGKADAVATDLSDIKTNFALMQKKFGENFDEMQKRFGELTKAVSTIAVAEEKIAAVNNRLDDEKTEGTEFRSWLRGEIARMWTVIGEISNELKTARQDIGSVQGKVSAMLTRVGGPDPG
jgi:chromosome segregation ATPase